MLLLCFCSTMSLTDCRGEEEEEEEDGEKEDKEKLKGKEMGGIGRRVSLTDHYDRGGRGGREGGEEKQDKGNERGRERDKG